MVVEQATGMPDTVADTDQYRSHQAEIIINDVDQSDNEEVFTISHSALPYTIKCI